MGAVAVGPVQAAALGREDDGHAAYVRGEAFYSYRSAAKMTNFNRISSISGKYNKSFGFL